MHNVVDIRGILSSSGLKITPQRVAVLQAFYAMDNHPSAENIIDHINKENLSIPVGTIYKILDVLVEKGIIDKVKTDDAVMRFDRTTSLPHHHLYATDGSRIEDYVDDELDRLIANHFKRKKIKDFTITDFKLQITGNFQ